ncbi:hypothetical protein CNMCM5623_006358 [Aspergillus felis]|uniref:Carrier domain-containing protein n=1 Tax=Aspergillus felis TaxID=1287682 RepID=A0A8H6QKB0_9EURO|nr:hypothetical protein CNMCM5623_006358 [Aspergillus felis]
MVHFHKDEISGRLLASVVDEKARKHPHQKFCILPNGESPREGFYDVTFEDIARAVDQMSWWIARTLGPGDEDDQTLAYLGTNDIRYIIVFLACNKTGYRLFLPSPRNSTEAFLHLLKETNTKAVLHPPGFKEHIPGVGRLVTTMEIVEIPWLNELWRKQTSSYSYIKSFREEQDRIALIVHTSGTTGLPKPIFLTHGYCATVDNVRNFPLPKGRRSSIPCNPLFEGGAVLTVFPFFHIVGFFFFAQAVFSGLPFATPPSKPLSGDLVVKTLRELRVVSAALPPSLIENICSSDFGLKTLTQLNNLYFGGAPLSPEIGEMLRGRVKLNSLIGSTEMGILLSMRPLDEADWSYFEWAPNFNIHMDPVSDNFYELVLRRGDNREVNGIFHSFPSLLEYRSKDLYTRHPTKKHLWKYSGRSDDIIVLSNGEKFNPVDMEKIIEAHPLVSRALIVGQGRFHSALLIEPNWELWHSRKFPSDSAFLDEIWPKIREANAGAPAYGRVMRSKIALADENKPFKTTPKGTTQRRLVQQDYEDLIETLYRNDHKKDLECPDEGYLANILIFIRQAVHNQLEDKNVHDADDFYEAGFDSLQTVFLANTLSSAIKSKHPDWSLSINIHDVYAHPTIASLSQYVTDRLQGNKTDTKALRYERINHMIQKYRDSLRPERPFTMWRKRGNQHVVLLTGSTGSLGSYILDQLLSDHTVVKIYCLNRSADAETRQRQVHVERGLGLWQTGGERVEFVKAVFGDDKLGLSESKYNTLLATVDITIHNAWKLDFNRRVESFESLIKSVRDLLAFSLRGYWCPHLFFVSSISTIYGWDPTMGRPSAPEDIIENSDAVLEQGYAESKHIAERLCYEASKTAGVPTTILRVGQIGGPTRAEGIWNRNEWFPSLIATSARIGKIPTSLGTNEVDWIPVDSLAEIIMEIIHSRLGTHSSSASAACFHIVNPKKTSWKSLLPFVQSKLNVAPVAASEWISNLKNVIDPTEEDLLQMPALKLLDFYRGLLLSDSPLADVEVRNTMKISPTLANLHPISEQMIKNWLWQWGLGEDS